MARKDEAIPWDDCPYARSNANTFVRARAYMVFQPRVSGSTLGSPLGAFRHPWVAPSVDPSTPGGKTLYELASLKYCYNPKFVSKGKWDIPPYLKTSPSKEGLLDISNSELSLIPEENFGREGEGFHPQSASHVVCLPFRSDSCTRAFPS